MGVGAKSRDIDNPIVPLFVIAGVSGLSKPGHQSRDLTSWPNHEHSWQVTAGAEMVPKEIRHRVVVECDQDKALSLSPSKDIPIVAREWQVSEVSHSLDIDGLG